jgi:poly(hydroxyalkanoate) granule-associated protein
MSQSTEQTVNRLAQIDATKDAIRQVWLAGLGTIEMFQARRDQVFDKLVEEGEKFRSRNRKVAVEKLEAVQEETREVWHRIDRTLQDRVTSVLTWLRIPTKADVENLSKRVDVLNNSINGLSHLDVTRTSDRTRKSKLTAAA